MSGMDAISSASAMDPTTLLGSLAVCTAISVAYGYLKEKKSASARLHPPFKPTKSLAVKDSLVLAMLDEVANGEMRPCYVITDPDLNDNPIIYSSDAFCSFTQYKKSEVEGRNCRFLQGPQTEASDVKKIRDAVHSENEVSACLLNYKKDGSTFINQFFLCPLFDTKGKVAYYLGVQSAVDAIEDKQDGKNAGWRIFMWL